MNGKGATPFTGENNAYILTVLKEQPLSYTGCPYNLPGATGLERGPPCRE